LTHNTNKDSHIHTLDGDTIFSDRYSKMEKRILTEEEFNEKLNPRETEVE
jgi:hypothetical protein|tara:strand:- start:11 stop:160 length:150 start_codon:yes stop_codon:yes gene_type:complete